MPTVITHTMTEKVCALMMVSLTVAFMVLAAMVAAGSS